MRVQLRLDFQRTWNQERRTNRKLQFYNSIKSSFKQERYIDLSLSYKELKRLSQFRMSSHKYNIEIGRYGLKQGNNVCEYCSTDDRETLVLLRECPFFEPLIEFLPSDMLLSWLICVDITLRYVWKYLLL